MKTKVDPYLLAVVQGWFQQITNEMDALLVYSALSPTISEGNDRADGIYRETGEMVSQGEISLPVFIATMQDAVKTVREAALAEEGISDGDIFMMNDPYSGGSHLMDVKFFKPYFRSGKNLLWLANTGHWPDIGGAVTGGFLLGAREIYQEGLRIPPIKLYDKGKLNRQVLELLLANVRTSEERYGDLKAQVGTLNVAEQRLNSLFDKYGDDTVMACIDEMEERSERYMRSFISEIPDGTYSNTDYLDNDGVVNEGIAITVEITVNGDEMVVDFSNSAPPCKGNMNCPASCVRSAVFICLRHILPDLPLNAGMLRPVKIVIPENSFLNARFPSAVAGAAAEVSNRLLDTLSGAFAKVIPERVWAGAFGSINNLTIGGWDPKIGQYVLYMFYGGGLGGYDGGDGLTYGGPPVGISRAQTFEVFEQLYPVITRQFNIREGSAGAGQYRGGYGAVIEVEFLGEQEARLCHLGERGKYPPRGILGGKDARMNEFRIIRKDGEVYISPFVTKGETFINKGDVFQLLTPGGAGYGDPRKRERRLVIEDVLNEYYDKETAEREYGIVIDQKELDDLRREL